MCCLTMMTPLLRALVFLFLLGGEVVVFGQRNNNNCEFTTFGGPQVGQRCRFPFNFNGRIHTACTTDKDPDNRYRSRSALSQFQSLKIRRWENFFLVQKRLVTDFEAKKRCKRVGRTASASMQTEIKNA